MQTKSPNEPRSIVLSYGHISRRTFFKHSAKATLAATVMMPALVSGQDPTATKRKMTICLTPGSIGVSANQMEAVALAQRHGFEAVEPFGGYFGSAAEPQFSDVLAALKAKNLVWGAAGLSVDYRQDEKRFNEGMKRLPQVAAALQKAGVERVSTWLTPGHDSLTYLQNFRQHAHRLREAARVLKDHGQRLGLEYVGTFTLRARRKYPFVHTMAETRELIAEIGTGNVGFVLDSWHWWTAGDSVEDILSLKKEDVVSVDLNDAPAGVPKEQQVDGRRELPCATGVIDVAAFLNALQQIGYDGPVRAEPFNKALNDLDNDAACEATVKAMRKAFELIK
jgi:sugar phosphate isomerase/epimerase